MSIVLFNSSLNLGFGCLSTIVREQASGELFSYEVSLEFMLLKKNFVGDFPLVQLFLVLVILLSSEFTSVSCRICVNLFNDYSSDFNNELLQLAKVILEVLILPKVI